MTMAEKTPNIPASSIEPGLGRPEVPSNVVAKLLLFTFAMVTLPLTTYYQTVDRVFNGNNTYAAAAAAAAANVIAFTYIIAAVLEDRADLQIKKKA
ncbi:hypothetical protein BC936DRAFT_139587 [Jimgerdemannia flammicorona]|uniref:Uncharacterized protein n=2 Tax=Jimgerdemannia flammicorona TaxID=994334 RepID=A0A433QSU7_9FUNG|nr:hypothetical protein BC936DRAFT_139587 [Jimgerdemannia flammicorona]RUS32828.1 hypothetical protein BC938DRAFT_474144 [Jimgerdemannia flammicorona]